MELMVTVTVDMTDFLYQGFFVYFINYLLYINIILHNYIWLCYSITRNKSKQYNNWH